MLNTDKMYYLECVFADKITGLYVQPSLGTNYTHFSGLVELPRKISSMF